MEATINCAPTAPHVPEKTAATRVAVASGLPGPLGRTRARASGPLCAWEATQGPSDLVPHLVPPPKARTPDPGAPSLAVRRACFTAMADAEAPGSPAAAPLDASHPRLVFTCANPHHGSDCTR